MKRINIKKIAGFMIGKTLIENELKESKNQVSKNE